jgi:hypothetical protein
MKSQGGGQLPVSVLSSAAKACSLVVGEVGRRRLSARTSRKNVKTGHRWQ